MLLQLALWTVAWKARANAETALFGFCGGLAAGAATLMRPSWLLFTPLAAAVELLLGVRRFIAAFPGASEDRRAMTLVAQKRR